MNFLQIIILTGEPMHSASKQSNDATRPSYIKNKLPESKVSIILLWKLHMFNPLLSNTNQELFKKHLCNQSSHCKNAKGVMHPSWWCHALQISSEKWSIHYASLSAIFNLSHSSMNQQLFEKHLCNQSIHNEKYECVTCKRCHHVLPLNGHIKKDKCNKDTGKSMKNAFYIWQYAIRHLSGWSSEKSSP